MLVHSPNGRHISSRVSVAPLPELSRDLVRAQEAERKRISRELHDSTGQGLMVLRLYLSLMEHESETPDLQSKLQEALRLLDHTIEELRRVIGRLSPRALEELGLFAAIRREIRDFSRRTGISAQVELPKTPITLQHEIELALYRAVQECLQNIAKHSRARQFTVRLEEADGAIRLTIEDDGVGFSRKRDSRSSFGLLGMRERVAALGGRVRVRTPKTGGTRIKVMLPAQHSVSLRKAAAPERGIPFHLRDKFVAGGKTPARLKLVR